VERPSKTTIIEGVDNNGRGTTLTLDTHTTGIRARRRVLKRCTRLQYPLGPDEALPRSTANGSTRQDSSKMLKTLPLRGAA
jgi:hypothetical protein